MKIDAFLIGAPRCATTKIINCMYNNIHICPSHPKELKFFSIHYPKGGEELQKYYDVDENSCKFPEVFIYSNPIDCNMDYVRDRIYHHNPFAKIIMGVRNPIKRAISHWGIHRYKLPIGRVKTIWDEFDENVKTFSLSKFKSEGDFIPYCNEYGSCYIPQYLECSMYGNMMLKYSCFPSIHVYDFDEVQKDFVKEYSKILKYLGLKTQNIVDTNSNNSLLSHGSDINIDELAEEFKKRYPDIVNLFMMDACLLDKLTNYKFKFFEKWFTK